MAAAEADEIRAQAAAGRARAGGQAAAARLRRRARRDARSPRRHRRRRGGAVRRRSAAHVPALRRGAGLAVRADLGQRVRSRRLQGSDRLDQRHRRVRQTEVRKRRPPRPARAGDRKRRAHPHLGGDRRGAARGRGRRRPDRRQATCASTSIARRGPAASRSTPPTARCASPTCRPGWWSSSRTRNRSTRTRPRR